MRIFFGQGSGFSAWLIRVFTKSPFTHAGLVYDDDTVLHSTIGGVQLSDMDYINSHYDGIVEFDCLFDEDEIAADFVKNKWFGAKYDYLSFIGLGLAIIFNLKKNPLGLHKQLMCTELPVHWLNKVSAINTSLSIPYMDPEMVTPVGLINWVKSRTDLFELI
jgi:hypothetical protein